MTIKIFSDKKEIIIAVLITVAVFTWLQASPTLADPDSWYHAKITLMMRDYGLLYNFPWTQDSLYKLFFIDHHFLYHILLIPFISLGNPLVGIKIATIIFASFSVIMVLWLLKKLQTPYLSLWLILLLTNAGLIFRLNLAKAPSLSVGLIILGFYLIITQKKWWLFLYTWFFVWFYSAWPLIPLMLAVHHLVAAGYDISKTFSTQSITNWLTNWWRQLFNSQYLKMWSAVIGGVICGLIINPYFPNNIKYLTQLFGMALINYSKIIGIGAEWYPYLLPDLIEEVALILLILTLALILFVFSYKKQSRETITALILSIIFFIYTAKARRQIEYLVPWMIISAALIIKDYLLYTDLKTIWQKFISWLPWWLKGKTFTYFITIFLSLSILLAFIRGLNTAYEQSRNAFPLSHLSGASKWLANNTPYHSKVFQTDWGTFPLLFYNNIHNYYLTGLDQTFMYEYDKNKYQLWKDATTGKRTDIYYIVKEVFKADWILLETRRLDMLKDINRDPRFVKTYQDKEALIYKVIYD